MNRIVSIGYPAGNGASVSYGYSSKTAKRGGLAEITTYNTFRQPTGVSLGGISRSFRVDALGRRTFESNPGSSSGTSYRYDALDRITKISNADRTSSVISYGAGRKTVNDERGKSTTYTYRAYGDPNQQFVMRIAAPEPSANVSIVRNSNDLITSITQAGQTRRYSYNSNYYLTAQTDPETGTTSYGRDTSGNMTSRAVGSSGTTRYAYDGQNRLTSVTHPDDTPSITNTYSKTHKLLSANTSTGNRAFSYDANGNLIRESLTVDEIALTASYAYNGNDQLSSITYPQSGSVVSYSPDVLGRPTNVSGYVNAVQYWPSGQIKQINYANGTITRYNQNSRLWPSSFSTEKAGNPVNYINSSYRYDGIGNLTNVSDAVDATYNRVLGYDGINRLTGISGPWGSGTITYDGTGNITSQVLGGSARHYSYDGRNRLSSISGNRNATYNYDAYGNVVNDSGNIYAYDAASNLRCANCANAVNGIEYIYDGTGQRSRVIKAITVREPLIIRGQYHFDRDVVKRGVKTYEMYGSNGNQLVEFTPELSDKLVEYIYLGGKRIAQRLTPTPVSFAQQTEEE